MVGVSGGVDSMVLLDVLRQLPGVEIVVAHLNHGIREDSELDKKLVLAYSMSHNIKVITSAVKLGKNASEETARRARYDFLQRCCKQHKARAIVVAHHQDDLIETALINLSRGTGWRGLAPFSGHTEVIRPLLSFTKDQLLGYARRHELEWREDITNSDERYLRNFVRLSVVPVLNQKSKTWQTKFLLHIRKQQKIRGKIENLLNELVPNPGKLDRHLLIMTPPEVGYEIIQHAMRLTLGNSLERSLAEAALLFTKTAKPGKKMSLGNVWRLRATTGTIMVEMIS